MNLLNRRKSYRLSKLLLALILILSVFTESYSQDIQRIRINFTSPANDVRQLLLAFTPDNSATDNYDFGWDAINWSQHPNDLNWVIENYKCTIQAVGAYDFNKSYPLHLALGNSGDVKIDLHSIENFDDSINVYIYDSLIDSFHLINDETYIKDLEKGEYPNRFFIKFINNSVQQASLSNNDFEKEKVDVRYAKSTNELIVNSLSSSRIKTIETYSINGQLLNNYEARDKTSFKTLLSNSMNQILIIRVITDTGITSKKIII